MVKTIQILKIQNNDFDFRKDYLNWDSKLENSTQNSVNLKYSNSANRQKSQNLNTLLKIHQISARLLIEQ